MFGFVSKKKYDEAIKSRDFWENQYSCEVKKQLGRGYIYKRFDEIVSENKELKEQIFEYKQKYADEVQKRLELAKLIDTFEACDHVELRVNDEEI